VVLSTSSSTGGPNHEEHENYVRWNGGDTFDRTAFNLIEVNVALQKSGNAPAGTGIWWQSHSTSVIPCVGRVDMGPRFRFIG